MGLIAVPFDKQTAIRRQIVAGNALAKVTPRHGRAMLTKALWVKGIGRHANRREGVRLQFRLVHIDHGITVCGFAAVVIDAKRAFWVFHGVRE